MSGFKFGLSQNVSIKTSGESGLVLGRAEYFSSANSYLIRYKAADGRANEQWWGEDALETIQDLEK